jgi:serine/threonine protein kinase
VRRLYQCLLDEGLLEAVVGEAAIKEAERSKDGGDERSRAESLQMTLLDRVSREAEASLMTSGASFLGSVMLQEKKASIKDFKMLKVIGKGSFGKVLLALHARSGTTYAVKIMEKDVILAQDVAGRIMSEHNVLLGNEAHPFLVGLHYSFQTSSKLYFVLDYVNGGELYVCCICPPTHLSALRPYTFPSICPSSIHPPIHLHFVYLSTHPSALRPYIFPSIHPHGHSISQRSPQRCALYKATHGPTTNGQL